VVAEETVVIQQDVVLGLKHLVAKKFLLVTSLSASAAQNIVQATKSALAKIIHFSLLLMVMCFLRKAKAVVQQ